MPRSEVFDEQVYYLSLNSDDDGMSKVALVNAELGWGIYEKFDTRQLPNFIQWKNLGAGEYVMGLEISNSFPDGRDKERAQGRLPFIQLVKRRHTVLSWELLKAIRQLVR